MRELLLQIGRCGGVQLKELLRAPAPHGVLHRIGDIVRLVPDLPVADGIVEAVRPALGIVPDDALAYLCPRERITRRPDTCRVHCPLILNGHAQSEERLGSALHKLRDQQVGKAKAVRGGISGISVRIGEQIGDIHKPAAAKVAADVVQAGEGDPRLSQVVEHTAVIAACGGLSDAVQGLDACAGIRKINAYHSSSPLFALWRLRIIQRFPCVFQKLRSFGSKLCPDGFCPPGAVSAVVGSHASSGSADAGFSVTAEPTTSENAACGFCMRIFSTVI